MSLLVGFDAVIHTIERKIKEIIPKFMSFFHTVDLYNLIEGTWKDDLVMVRKGFQTSSLV